MDLTGENAISIIVEKPIAAPTTILYPAAPDTSRTFVIMGTARGGTSMIAGLLRQLGIHLGSDIDESTHEDQEFTTHGGDRELFTSPSRKLDRDRFIKAVKDVVRRRNDSFDVWGWKDPLSSYYMPLVEDKIRNPWYIMVARDITAVGQREMLEESVERSAFMANFMQIATKEYEQMLNFLVKSKRPTLIVSYERALRHREEFISQLINFISIGSNKKQVTKKLVSFIEPDRRSGEIGVVDTTSTTAAEFNSFGRKAVATTVSHHFSAYYDALAESAGAFKLNRPFKVDSNEELVSAYIKSAAALNSGAVETALGICDSAIEFLARDHSQLSYGPAFVELYESGIGEDPIRREMAFAIYFLTGLAHLVSGNHRNSYRYLRVAYRWCREFANVDGNSLMENLYWAAVFHYALVCSYIGLPRESALVRTMFDRGDPQTNAMTTKDGFELYRARIDELPADVL